MEPVEPRTAIFFTLLILVQRSCENGGVNLGQEGKSRVGKDRWREKTGAGTAVTTEIEGLSENEETTERRTQRTPS